MTTRNRSRRLRVLGVIVACFALVAAACGDDDTSDDTGGGGDSGATVNDDATAADDSLEPVKIGFINQEAGSVGSYPEAWVAAQAAVEYINAELGGVDGHPIEVVKCVTDGTTQSSQRCAEQMVSEDVALVSSGVDATRAAWYSVIIPAGIPSVGGVPLTGADYEQDGAYFIHGGGSTVFPSQPAYVLELADDVDSVGLMSNDTPGSLSAIPLITSALEDGGVDVTEVQVPASQSDWLAPFVSVSDTDVIIANINPQNCISLAEAMRTQGSDVPVLTTSSCQADSVIDAVGDGVDGWKIISSYLDPNGDAEDAVTYRNVMETYAGEGAQLTGFAAYAFSDLMTIYNNVLADADYDSVTAEFVQERITDPAGGHVFLADDYNCAAADRPYAAICNYKQSFATIEGGTIVDQSDFIDVSSYIS